MCQEHIEEIEKINLYYAEIIATLKDEIRALETALSGYRETMPLINKKINQLEFKIIKQQKELTAVKEVI